MLGITSNVPYFTEAKYTFPAYHMALRWDVISILDFLTISIKSYGKYREKEANTVLRYSLYFIQESVPERLLRTFSSNTIWWTRTNDLH